MKRGLLDEVRQLKSLSNDENKDVDYATGIFQSIGIRSILLLELA
jgi:hypothetical protein